MALIPTIVKDDWPGLNRILRKLASTKLGPTASPTFAGLTLTGLTATRLTATDGSKGLASTDLISWVAGTTDEINVADVGNGTITIGIVDPLIVGKGGTGAATLADHGILLGSGTGAVTPLGVATNGQLPIGSTGADPVLAGLTGTANQITVTNGVGSITLSTPQDIHTGASPTFADLTLTAPVNIYALSHDSFADFVADEHIDWTSAPVGKSIVLASGQSITDGVATLVGGLLSNVNISAGSILSSVFGNLNPITHASYGIGVTGNRWTNIYLTGGVFAGTTTLSPGAITTTSGNLSITADGGTIDFGDDNIATTGPLNAGIITGTSYKIGAANALRIVGTNLLVGNAGTNITTTATQVVAIGDLALATDNDEVSNICIGGEAGRYVETPYNLFLGFRAGLGVSGSSSGVGYNMGIGSNALRGLTSGAYNTCLGTDAGRVLTTSLGATFVGFRAGYSVTGGWGQTALGPSAAKTRIASGFTCVGGSAGYASGTGGSFIGYESGKGNTGNYTTAIGYRSGYTGDGTNCLFLGRSSGYFETGSYIFMVDSIVNTDATRNSEANQRLAALLYGVMGTTVTNQSLNINGSLKVGNATYGQTSYFGDGGIADHVAISATGDLTFAGTARLRLSSITDSGPMTATNGTAGDIIFNTSDTKAYVCTVTGSPATWAALN